MNRVVEAFLMTITMFREFWFVACCVNTGRVDVRDVGADPPEVRANLEKQTQRIFQATLFPSFRIDSTGVHVSVSYDVHR